MTEIISGQFPPTVGTRATVAKKNLVLRGRKLKQNNIYIYIYIYISSSPAVCQLVIYYLMNHKIVEKASSTFWEISFLADSWMRQLTPLSRLYSKRRRLPEPLKVIYYAVKSRLFTPHKNQTVKMTLCHLTGGFVSRLFLGQDWETSWSFHRLPGN